MKTVSRVAKCDKRLRRLKIFVFLVKEVIGQKTIIHILMLPTDAAPKNVIWGLYRPKIVFLIQTYIAYFKDNLFW